ncbi:MAG: radical SAM protein [Deltaproteobacteria bacterium]|nr:radical SAM protein [Deltaproteobacteria bacterium]
MESRPDFYPLRAIYLNPIDRCNLKCRHCWLSPEPLIARDTLVGPHSGIESGPSLGVMKRVIGEAKPLGLDTIKLTGGEPFLRKDIIELVGLFHDEGLYVDIESNGTLINGQVAKKLKQYRVRSISVSLDGAKEETHDLLRGVKGAFRSAIRGIRYLREYGLNIQVIMSLSRTNSKEIPRMAELASELGVQSLKINPILPIGRGLAMHRKMETLTVEEILHTADRVHRELKRKVNIPISLCIPVAFLPLKDIMEDNHSQCAILNILGIVENGDISFCGIQKVEKDLVMGNIHRDRLSEIWKHHPLLAFMREAIPGQLKGICKKCFFKKTCLGNCIACTYHLSKSLTEPYWFCQEAYRIGRFPETRYIH